MHFRDAAKRPDADPRMGSYVYGSLVGAICGGIAFVSWVVVVQLSWREAPDYWRALMLVMPETNDDL